MSRSKISWVMVVMTLVLLASLAAPAFPQTPGDDGAAPPADAVVAEDAEPSHAAVNQILREQEEVLRGDHFAYEPAGRRDPFVSLMTPRIVEIERPPGVAGMLVSELDLAGVVRDRSSGDLAMVIGSDNKGYFLRPGDAVFDGTVIAIDSGRGTITFRQEVDDPRLIKPYRDVVKRLVPLEGDGNE